MAQVIEWLPSKCEALSFNPSFVEGRKGRREKGKKEGRKEMRK
jgi:hypothetical protein